MSRFPKAILRSHLRCRWVPMLALLAVAAASCGDDDCDETAGPPTAPAPLDGAVAYVPQPDAALLIYSVDSSGMLTSVDKPTLIPGSRSLALSPASDFAFVSYQPDPSNDMGAVRAYRVDPDDGSLTAAGAEQTTRLPMTATVVHPTGGFLYGVAPVPMDVNLPGGTFAFAIDATSGELNPVRGSPYPTALGNATALAMHPSGGSLYVLYDGGAIEAWVIDETNGTLGAVPTSGSAGIFPGSIEIDPSGRFMYVANSAGVYGFSVDATGALSPLTGSPFANVAGQSLAIHPSGRFIYVSNSSGETIDGFAIDPNTGFLTALPGEGAATGSTPVATAVDATGQFAYVVNRTGRSISAYAIDAMTGALTTVGTAPTTSDAVGITLRPSQTPPSQDTTTSNQ